MPTTGPIFRVFCDRHGLAALPAVTQTAALYLKIPRDAAVSKSALIAPSKSLEPPRSAILQGFPENGVTVTNFKNLLIWRRP